MELSPNDQLFQSVWKIAEECRRILDAMDKLEKEQAFKEEAAGTLNAIKDFTSCLDKIAWKKDTCPHGIAVDANLPCTRCEYERRGK